MEPQLTQAFLISAQNMIMQMTGIKSKVIRDFLPEKDEYVSFGVGSIISITGKIKGRLLLDMEPTLALGVAETVMGEKYRSVKERMVLASISELNNIIAGDANTYLNNQYHLSLRLAPPVAFAGHNPLVCIPKIASASAECSTSYGLLRINVAFEGGL